jgi:alcohol dehydrogenase
VSQRWLHVSVPQQVSYGAGQAERLRPLLKEAGVRRTLVVGTARGLASPSGQKLLGGLGRTVEQTVFTLEREGGALPAEAVQAASRQAHATGVDSIVAFGSGAVVDLAKAVTFFLEQQAGTPGTSFADSPAVTQVAVPTTFCVAVGSTHFAMTAGRQVHVGASPTLAPRYVVWDPAALADLPALEVARTGFGALGRALEATVALARSPETEAVALAAFGRVYGALAAAVEGDDQARERLVEGVALTARAALGAGVPGPAHGLAQVLAGRAGASYGGAMAAVLPIVVDFTAEPLRPQLEQVARLVFSDDLGATLRELAAEVGLGQGLGALGVSGEDADAVARLSQANPFVQASARPMDEPTVRGLLDAAGA